jgi:predicted transposase/invertase (TIGR01784 family)
MPGPHDLFARFAFGQPERAAAELRAVLPQELAARVDWSSLRRESGSVVDPELRESQSDLLFSARLHGGQPVLLYLLLEHQSSVDRWMALRMLRYVVRQLERWRREHPESEALPGVIPVVMYHGPEGAWTAPRRVEELFSLPSEGEEAARWRALVPRFEYLLDDLTSEREESLKARAGPPMARLGLLVLRFGRTEELASKLEGWKTLLAEVHSTAEGLEELRAIVHYLLKVGAEAAHEALGRVLHSVAGAQRAEELMRTIGDKLIEQGRMEGLAKGRAEGRAEGRARERAEVVIRILTMRGISVDPTACQLILSCTDLETLDRWFERALNVTSLSELLTNG